MPQTTYSLNQDEGFAGLIADSRFHEVESKNGLAAVNFGFGVVAGEADPANVVRVPNINNVVILDDAGTFTAGDIVVTVNGTDVTETFASDKDTTMAALAVSLAALATIATAVYVGGSTHTITIVAADDVDLIITVSVAAITGTMTITSITGTSTDLVRGIAVHTQMKNQTLPTIGASTFNAAGYLANDAIGVMRKGVVWAEVADAVVIDAAVYLITTGTNKGKLTDETTTPNIIVPTAVFRSATSAAGIAKVEINVP